MVSLPPFQTLLDEHAGDLARFVRAMAGPNDADDVFQDTVVSALRAYPALRHTDNLRGWLFTIASRKVVDRGRRRSRSPVVLDLASDGAHEPAGVDPPSPAEADEALWAAVRRLPERQRGCVTARYVLDLPYREVGALVGCSEEAARQNVREALRKLKEELGDG